MERGRTTFVQCVKDCISLPFSESIQATDDRPDNPSKCLCIK